MSKEEDEFFYTKLQTTCLEAGEGLGERVKELFEGHHKLGLEDLREVCGPGIAVIFWRGYNRVLDEEEV